MQNDRNDFQAIICGDLHFEKLYRYFPKKENADEFIFQQLDKLVSYAKKLQIKHIIQLGDIFDHPQPSQNTIKNFLNYLHKHQDLEWIFILGNHDYNSRNINSMEICEFLAFNNILPNVRIYNKPGHLQINGVDLFFSPFPNTQKFESLKNKPCICFGHFEVQGATADNGSPITKGVDSNALQKEDFWILGHLHRMQIKDRINYIGTQLQFSFGEPAEKFFGILKVEDQIPSLEILPIDLPYKFINVKLKEEKDLNLEFKEGCLYKLFVVNDALNINKLIKRGEGYIYKIEYMKVEKKDGDLNLTDIFLEETEKEKHFNNFEGIDQYLKNLNLSEKQINVALDLISSEKINYKPNRN